MASESRRVAERRNFVRPDLRLIGEVRRSRTVIRVCLCPGERGTTYVDLRKYEPNGEKQMVRTNVGLTVAPRHLDDLITTLQEAKRLATAEGLI